MRYEPIPMMSAFWRSLVTSSWVRTNVPTIRRVSRTYRSGGQWSLSVNSSAHSP